MDDSVIPSAVASPRRIRASSISNARSDLNESIRSFKRKSKVSERLSRQYRSSYSPSKSNPIIETTPTIIPPALPVSY